MAKQFRLALFGVAAVISASSAWARGPKLLPGLWKFTESSQSAGDTPSAPRTFQRCLTPADVEGFGDKIVAGQGVRITPKVHCEISGLDESSSSLNWTYKCSGEITLTSVGSINFDSPTHYTGAIKTSGAVQNTLNVEGSRIGSCANAD